MAVEGIKRNLEGDIRPRLDHPEVLDALRKGNIPDVVKALPAGVTIQDIEEYLKHRWVVLDQGLFQNAQIKADEAAAPPPTIEGILPTPSDDALTPADRALLRGAMGAGKAALDGRAAEKGKGGAATGGVGADHLTGTVDAHLREFRDFMNDVQNTIIEVQLGQELEAKHQELQRQLNEIVAKMRDGTLDPEYVLIALAKVQISERGLLFTQYGQRMMHANAEQSRIAQEISLQDPSKLGDLPVKQQQMGKETMQIQQFASMMQKISQDIEAIFAFAKGASEEIIKTKLELARKAEVRAG